jgi:hypothetical protein
LFLFFVFYQKGTVIAGEGFVFGYAEAFCLLLLWVEHIFVGSFAALLFSLF